jgi:hypothetical protein
MRELLWLAKAIELDSSAALHTQNRLLEQISGFTLREHLKAAVLRSQIGIFITLANKPVQ